MTQPHTASPYFSIVIPAFNREKEIVRAIDSCLKQSFPEFEVVVVDDASTDHTAAVVASIQDSRVKLVRHEVNRNVCPARNTGSEHSRGEWVIFLDSDDILMPGALHMMWKYARVCPDEIAQLGFLFDREDGRVSPEPVPEDCLLDYTGFIKLCEELVLTDWVQCTRRFTFDFVRFPDSRAYESPYLLDFSQKYKIHLIPEIAGYKFLDSPNRITFNVGSDVILKISRVAPDHLAAIEYILMRHGEMLKIHAPGRYHLFRKMQLLSCFLTGRRWQGCSLAIAYLLAYPGDIAGWGITIAGLAGPGVLTKLRLAKQQIRRMTTKQILRSKTTQGGA